MTTCHECNDTGERDSGGTHPWGEPVYLPCDCKDAEIGKRWRENSSLEKWFPLTAERLARLEAENAALKHDLQYARDGLTKGRSRMREDNERLAREAHTWSKAAETYAAELERHKPLMQGGGVDSRRRPHEPRAPCPPARRVGRGLTCFGCTVQGLIESSLCA